LYEVAVPGAARGAFDRRIGDAIHSGWRALERYGAIGPRHRRARRFHHFGAGSMISFPPAVIFGEGRISIGEHTSIGPYASLSAGMPMHADARGEPIIRIGDRTVLGKGIGIVGHRSIEIGDDIWTGHYVYITDQNHGYEDLSLPIGTQMWRDEPVRIGSGSWLGHGVVVLPGVTIGEHVAIGAGAVVTGDLPDRCVAAGVPARVIRRYDDTDGWVSGAGSAS
jgi:acetyltransferase-like isoleucine patch superfamily enzyme